MAVNYCVVTDKGHSSTSSNKSVVEFWIRQPGESDSSMNKDSKKEVPTSTGETLSEFPLEQAAPLENQDDQSGMMDNLPSSLAGQSSMMSDIMSTLSGATAEMKDVLATSNADLAAIRERLSAFESWGASSSTALPSSSGMPAQSIAPTAPGTVVQTTVASSLPYSTSYLEKLSKAGGSKDDKAMNLFLNRHGDATSVFTALDGLERYFSERLDTAAAFLANQIGLAPALGSSWSSLKSAVRSALEEEPLRSSSSISLGYVLHTMSKQTPPASPEKAHRKAPRKR